MLCSSLALEDAGDILSITDKRRAFIAINVSEVYHNFTTERDKTFPTCPKLKLSWASVYNKLGQDILTILRTT